MHSFWEDYENEENAPLNEKCKSPQKLIPSLGDFFFSTLHCTAGRFFCYPSPYTAVVVVVVPCKSNATVLFAGSSQTKNYCIFVQLMPNFDGCGFCLHHSPPPTLYSTIMLVQIHSSLPAASDHHYHSQLFHLNPSSSSSAAVLLPLPLQ